MLVQTKNCTGRLFKDIFLYKRQTKNRIVCYAKSARGVCVYDFFTLYNFPLAFLIDRYVFNVICQDRTATINVLAQTYLNHNIFHPRRNSPGLWTRMVPHLFHKLDFFHFLSDISVSPGYQYNTRKARSIYLVRCTVLNCRVHMTGTRKIKPVGILLLTKRGSSFFLNKIK